MQPIEELPDLGIITDDGVLIEEQLSPNIFLTKENYLLCENAIVARLGVQEYTPQEIGINAGPDGKVYLIRNKDEVFKETSLASFAGKPITVGHPREMINSSNWSLYAKGTIQSAYQDGSLVRATFLITDAETVRKVQEQGLRKLSCGYYSMLEPVGEGQANQTNIMLNHIALVTNPRAGDIASIVDEKPGINSTNIEQTSTKDSKMSKQQKVKKSIWSFLKIMDEQADKLAEELVDEDQELTDADEAHEAAETAEENTIEATLKSLIARLDKLEAMNKQEVTDEDEEKDASCTDEDETKEEEKAEVTDEEETETEDEDAEGDYAVADSLNTIISKVEILSPGFKVNKADKVASIKKSVLSHVAITDAASLAPFLAGKTVDQLSAEVLDLTFNAAVELKKTKNNSALKVNTFITDSNPKADMFAGHLSRFYSANK